MTEEKSWEGRSVASSGGIWIFMKAIRLLGLGPAYFILWFTAAYYTVFVRFYVKYLKSYRKKLNLKTNFWNIYKHDYYLGANMVDRFAHLVMKKSPFHFTCIGEHFLHEALNQKKGMILISSHVGNQEIGGDVLFEHLKTRVNFVQLDNEKESIKNVTKQATEKREINIISTNLDDLEMMIQIKNALNNNEIVCFLGDRVMGNEDSKPINFLGKETRFPTGPFRVALITGAPVITTVTVKTGFKTYLQKVYNQITFDNISRSDRDHYLQKAMEEYATNLEEMVREYPYQWFNFYDYWGEFT